jgi:hypothetical protein
MIRVQTTHETARFLAQSPEILKVLVEANSIKSAPLRQGVLYILSEALINANDTLDDGYDKWAKQDYVSPCEFWRAIFRSSAQSLSTERNVSKPVQNWLARRGLFG